MNATGGLNFYCVEQAAERLRKQGLLWVGKPGVALATRRPALPFVASLPRSYLKLVLPEKVLQPFAVSVTRHSQRVAAFRLFADVRTAVIVAAPSAARPPCQRIVCVQLRAFVNNNSVVTFGFCAGCNSG
jgi:hypothetical protein